jgi:dTDP-4-dehydrorhamnose 3,5-epimerase
MSARFDLIDTPLPPLKTIVRKPIGDARGYLERMLCVREMESLLCGKAIVQINRTLTGARGTVRGMHFQRPPHSEIKVVSCLRGQVFDVAVDLRRDSSTFLQWHGEILGGDNHRSLVIPEGFAHGFQTLTEDCEMLYFHTALYEPDCEGGVHAEDPRLNVRWPLPVRGLSPRDSAFPFVESEPARLTL